MSDKNKNKLEKLKKKYEELGKEIKALESQEEKELDFSKFIGRNDDRLAIKGKKLLKSYPDGDIFYSNDAREFYNTPINSEIVNISDLKVGDVFCNSELKPEKAKIYDFEIFMGEDDYGDYIVMSLVIYNGVEIIANSCYKGIKVRRFLRE